ncbi:hypothetical protein ABZ826_34835 [Streptomyces sp. NPDC047515]|uniref:hypothetical protein n=1 Tax=Streptomyces sp. NPDC047515 TaxID=3155380 RepID=UPI0033EB88B4
MHDVGVHGVPAGLGGWGGYVGGVAEGWFGAYGGGLWGTVGPVTGGWVGAPGGRVVACPAEAPGGIGSAGSVGPVADGPAPGGYGGTVAAPVGCGGCRTARSRRSISAASGSGSRPSDSRSGWPADRSHRAASSAGVMRASGSAARQRSSNGRSSCG